MELPATDLGSPDNDALRVALSVSEPWARDSAARAVRSSGGTPILLSSLADMPSVSDVCVGTICDLSPWNDWAVETFKEVRQNTPLGLFLIYIPETRKGIAAPLDNGDPAVRCCVQDPSPAALAGLRNALGWLLESGASSSLISIVLDGRPPANPTCLRFLWWAIRAVGKRRGAPVTAAARELGVSTRTLARRLYDSELPPPVELYGWIKLMAVAWTAERTQTTLGKAALVFQLNSMRLYQLKIRLLGPQRLPIIRSSRTPMTIVVDAFRERCRNLRGPWPDEFTRIH